MASATTRGVLARDRSTAGRGPARLLFRPNPVATLGLGAAMRARTGRHRPDTPYLNDSRSQAPAAAPEARSMELLQKAWSIRPTSMKSYELGMRHCERRLQWPQRSSSLSSSPAASACVFCSSTRSVFMVRRAEGERVVPEPASKRERQDFHGLHEITLSAQVDSVALDRDRLDRLDERTSIRVEPARRHAHSSGRRRSRRLYPETKLRNPVAIPSQHASATSRGGLSTGPRRGDAPQC